MSYLILGWCIVRAVFVLDDFFPTRIAYWLFVIYHFIALVSLYQIFLEFSDLSYWYEISEPKLWSVRLRKMNISGTFFFTSSIEAPKLQR
jgi:hypothetical protein